ncbi:MAG TPA: ABC transporter ATP-binding protein [Syntrophothermus lipocalidus]|uniref:ABC transporter related protein n=1 Tax=Syntrophothermus lipocalidus (strain DSM 12680 / TGB-C1) TaxID=643648 RepID=D7CM64_SYNLT|nr:ABC transporter ATP-binding protein [Syntrophothermus lipocalidus]ADI01799.1 ABC transporter related protein [Syntrophothermus lipocalidus DSM 12680]HHV77197.1 ABC transporter ATP-binding protein [Syntrophothermus lipocalidus]HOV42724.1 ABC transporter ATP-binding protein [Syntrophothermus lipocalidus]
MPLSLCHISKEFDGLKVLEDLTLEVKENTLTCILGPSGSGKTTLLNIIAGIIEPDAGEMVGFAGHRISYIFQETRLLKWKTVRGNLDFVLKDHLSPSARQQTISHYLQLVGLEEFQNYYPEKLSGGMKQRVSLARAFAYPAEILLMDEPFVGLDLGLKLSLMHSFLDLWLAERRSTFFVTHDIQEALFLGEEVFVLTHRPGRIKGHLTIDIPHRERSLQRQEMADLQETLYRLLTE